MIKVEVEAEDKTVELTETLIIRSTERFHSYGQLIYAVSFQKKVFTYEKSSPPEDWLGTPIWPPWRRVKTLYYAKIEFNNNSFFNDISADEIPCKLSRKNVIFSQVKISSLL